MKVDYFQLGDRSTSGVPSAFLDKIPSTFHIPSGTPAGVPAGEAIRPGPLVSTAQALFGDNTWFTLANAVLQQEEQPTNTTMLAYLDLICLYMPLQNADYFFAQNIVSELCSLQMASTGSGFSEVYNSQNATFHMLLASMVRDWLQYTFAKPYMAEAVLDTGAFFANNYTLSEALEVAMELVPGIRSGDGEARTSVYSYDGIHADPVIPVFSLGATVGISILVGLQSLAVFALLVYIYSKRVWTRSLDALAIATLGAQLVELHILDRGGLASGDLGVVVTPEASRKRLWKMNGLINPEIVHRNTGLPSVEDLEMTALPPPYAPRGHRPASSEVRSIEVGSAAGERPLSAPRYTPPQGEGEGFG